MVIELATLVAVVRIISLAALLVTSVYTLSKWLRRPPTRRLIANAFRALRITRSTRQVRTTLLKNLFLQSFIRERSLTRWILHISIFLGAGGLLVFHGLPRIALGRTELEVFPWAPFLLRMTTHNIFFAILILGTIVATLRRSFRRTKFRIGIKKYDSIPLFILLMIGVTGFLSWQIEYEPAVISATDPIQARSSFFLAHMLTVYVVVALFPLTKLFHWFVRLLSPIVAFYQEAWGGVAIQKCSECGVGYAPERQVADVAAIIPDLRADLLTLCHDCRRRRRLQEIARR